MIVTLALLLPMTALWLYSLRARDVSIVDIAWGPAFLVVTAAAASQDAGPRAALLLGMVGLWALRLGGYLYLRNHGRPEDSRYAAMRARIPGFAWKSLIIVFWFQAALVLLVSVPVRWGVGSRDPVGVLTLIGVALWGVGLVFETVGDLQLARFKADPGNAGKVMDQGLWRYTRHPNYFGDFCVWWGLWLASGQWWAFFGPLVMSWLLLRVSGVTLLERTIVDRRPGYRDYIARTSAFFPRPPRRA